MNWQEVDAAVDELAALLFRCERESSGVCVGVVSNIGN
jgi:hypothetical protein